MGGQQIGERLKAYRRERGLSQRQLAVKSGVSQPSISKLEALERVRISHDELAKIEAALQLPEGALTTEADAHPSLQAFLDSDFNKSLDPPLSPAELTVLRASRWYARGQDPIPAAWYALVQAMRLVK